MVHVITQGCPACVGDYTVQGEFSVGLAGYLCYEVLALQRVESVPLSDQAVSLERMVSVVEVDHLTSSDRVSGAE